MIGYALLVLDPRLVSVSLGVIVVIRNSDYFDSRVAAMAIDLRGGALVD